MLGLASAALAAGMLATAYTSVGFALSHYNVAFLALTAVGAALWARLKRRRVASIGMAYTGVLATATGFVMLYTRQFPLKEWITWWHSVTSFAFLAFFLAHWALNNVRLVDFTKRLLAQTRAAAPVALAWAGVLVAFAWTWSPAGRGLFTRENYLHLATWAVFVGIGLTYGVWLVFRHKAMRARLARDPTRRSARGLVDTSLFLACWASLLTGFLLVYFAPFFDANGLKYVSKWWHTATSVALLAIVALHIGFNARLVAAHAKRLDRELSPAPVEAETPSPAP